MYHKNVNYSPRKKRINKKIIVIVTIVILFSSILYLQRVRLQLLIKGYSFSEQSVLLELDDIRPYLEHSKIDNLLEWHRLDTDMLYIEYDTYYSLHPTKSKEEIVTFIDTFNAEYRLDMETLGYDNDTVWRILENSTWEQIEFIINNTIAYEDVKDFLAVPFFQIDDLLLYIQNKNTYDLPITNILMTSYPNIDAKNDSNTIYQVNEPDHLLILVKKGFQLPQDFEPTDLVMPNIPIAPDSTSPMLRKEAAEALEKMTKDAKKEGYHLVLNSGYRSYEQQRQLYDLYFERYDEVTASGLVAIPGTSEHQTGLAVDLTSQSVLDGERMVFGDTAERQWLFANAHNYGFIVRYPEDRTDITGTTAEPWHYRYVGVEVAREIQEKNWLLEDYILEYGFMYSLTKQ